MRRHTKAALASLLCLAPAVVGFRAVTAAMEMQPESRLWITGSSTVRGFTCKATTFESKVESVVPGAVTAVLGGSKAVGAVEVKVPTEKLECGNGTMNEHMLKALKAKDNPVIAFRLASYELAKAGDGMGVKLNGSLTLGGVTKPVEIDAVAKEGAKGALQVTGTYELKMTEFSLKPPTLMFGTMKVDERVKVGFDLLLKD